MNRELLLIELDSYFIFYPPARPCEWFCLTFIGGIRQYHWFILLMGNGDFTEWIDVDSLYSVIDYPRRSRGIRVFQSTSLDLEPLHLTLQLLNVIYLFHLFLSAKDGGGYSPTPT